MTVYVDELHQWPTKIRCFRGGSCHMTADTLWELHEMADAIGLRPEWFQPKSAPHYDLTPAKRKRALLAGAVFVPGKQQARDRIRKRAEYLLQDPLV